jgi:hypothetical protein
LAKRESFLLRVDPQVLEALRRWASDDLRSVNGQIEFLLRRALIEEGRLPKKTRTGGRRRTTRGDEPED